MLSFNTTMLDVSSQIQSGHKGQDEALKDWLLAFIVNGFSNEFENPAEICDVLDRAIEELRMKNPQSELDKESNFDLLEYENQISYKDKA